MNNMRNQMQASVPGMSLGASERAQVIGDLKLQTASMLRAFGRERAAMVKAMKSELATDRASRSSSLSVIRQQTNAMCEGFRSDHGGMRRALRKSLRESTQSIVNYVAALRVEVAKDRADFFRVFDQMSATQHAALVSNRRSRSSAVNNLIKDFHVKRVAMAQQLTDALAKSTQGIRAQVLDLRCAVGPMLRASTSVSLPVQVVSQRSASIKSESIAEPFSWPVSDPESMPVNLQAATPQEKSARADAGWHHESKQGKSKKK